MAAAVVESCDTVVPVRGLMGGWGRGFLIGDGLRMLSNAAELSIFSNVPSLLGLAGGAGACFFDGVGDSSGSVELTSGLSFAGFFGGRGFENLSFCVLALGLSGSTYI